MNSTPALFIIRPRYLGPLPLAALSLASILCLLLASGCAPKRPEAPPEIPTPKPVEFVPAGRGEVIAFLTRLNPRPQGFDSWTALRPGLEESLRYAGAKKRNAPAVDAPGLKLSWGRVADTVSLLMDLLPRLDRDPGLLAREFDWYALKPSTLSTGYYEPWLEASLTPDPDYPYPLYAVPPDLQTLNLGDFHPRWKGQRLIYRVEDGQALPYHDREAIDFQGALKGRGCEIAWARDIMDIFDLQIQGSGRLILPDGSVRHILYAGKNGREFTSLAREMANRGLLDINRASMRNMRAYLAEHPERMEELLATNPSYVFFRLSDSGPYGASGAELTPMASVAVDPKLIPLGAVLGLAMDLPPDAEGKTPRLNGLAMAQDTGGAIKQNHIDLFCGSGEEALDVARYMKQDATLYVLAIKNRP